MTPDVYPSAVRPPRTRRVAPVLAALCAVSTVTAGAATAAPASSLERGRMVPALGKRLTAAAPELDAHVLGLALDAATAAGRQRLAARPGILTVIDYSLPSTEKRLWVFDLERGALLFHELVAHGKGTGEDLAVRFSNRAGSFQTSLGVFRTADVYNGRNGYSLRLEGLEAGVNDRALARAIVIHGAPYVSRDFIRRHGRLGRSWGCPALDEAVAREVIDTIKGGSLVVAYYPDRGWLRSSQFLTGSPVLPSVLTAAP